MCHLHTRQPTHLLLQLVTSLHSSTAAVQSRATLQHCLQQQTYQQNIVMWVRVSKLTCYLPAPLLRVAVIFRKFDVKQGLVPRIHTLACGFELFRCLEVGLASRKQAYNELSVAAKQKHSSAGKHQCDRACRQLPCL